MVPYSCVVYQTSRSVFYLHIKDIHICFILMRWLGQLSTISAIWYHDVYKPLWYHNESYLKSSEIRKRSKTRGRTSFTLISFIDYVFFRFGLNPCSKLFRWFEMQYSCKRRNPGVSKVSHVCFYCECRSTIQNVMRPMPAKYRALKCGKVVKNIAHLNARVPCKVSRVINCTNFLRVGTTWINGSYWP